MTTFLPAFRADVSIDVHHENNESYLVLHDPFGIADGPIMVHADMVEILEQCDGETTWETFADARGLAADGTEMLRVRSFVGQLDQMGYFDTEYARKREDDMLTAWEQLDVRPPVCAGTTYPADAAELHTTITSLCSVENAEPDAQVDNPKMLLMPHIDFRVAGDSYAQATRCLQTVQADLVVMIGTSHYWADDTIILTTKHYSSPLGTLPTNRDLVHKLQTALVDRGLSVSSTDLAHKPEHSLELHTVLLQHAVSNPNLEVLPILVGGSGTVDIAGMMAIAETLRMVVEGSGRSVCWLVSGDMSHYGRRFASHKDASELHDSVTQIDHALLDFLRAANVSRFHQMLADSNNNTNVCGHGPLVLALLAAQPSSGTILSYECWDDVDTRSAVTFASMAWE